MDMSTDIARAVQSEVLALYPGAKVRMRRPFKDLDYYTVTVISQSFQGTDIEARRSKLTPVITKQLGRNLQGITIYPFTPEEHSLISS